MDYKVIEMEYVELKDIRILGNRCEYIFTYPEILAKYIPDQEQTLFFELPNSYDLHNVPEGILTIPFVGSVMCVTMLLGIGIKVHCLDENYYNSIPRIADTYHSMFPYADFCFDVIVDEVKDYTYTPREKPSVFFTGGLDATSALIEHIEEKPTLINIWGGDIVLHDIDTHSALEAYFQRLTTQIKNDYVFVRSNCRYFFDDHKVTLFLSTILRQTDDHGWWASIAHIPSMVSTIAPLLFVENIGFHYIGSTYSESSTGFDANNEKMVNSISFSSCTFLSVDKDIDRCEKARKIVGYCTENNLRIELMVCWHQIAAQNCSHCEKCYRTILDILSCKADPNDYGFKIDEKGYEDLKRFMQSTRLNEGFWQEIIDNFKKDRKYWKKNKNISWILNTKLNNFDRKHSRAYIALSRLYHKIKDFKL